MNDSMSIEVTQQIPTKELFRHPTPGITSVDLITELKKRGEIKPRDTVKSILGRVALSHALAAIPTLTRTVLSPTRPFDKMPNHLEVDELPSSKIEVEGRKIKLHGIYHADDDFGPKNNPLFGLQKYVRTTMQDGDIWFIEDKLKKKYKLTGTLGMTDHSVVQAYQSTHPYIIDLRKMPSVLKPLTKQLFPIIAFGKVTEEMFKATYDYGYPIIAYPFIFVWMTRLFFNQYDWLIARQVFNQINLPEPLTMEYVMAHTAMPNYKNHEADASIEQARQIRAGISLFSSHRTVHVLHGLSHESQVAYFLQHPEYNPRVSLQKARELLQQK